MIKCMKPDEMDYFLSLVPWEPVLNGVAILAAQGTVIWSYVADTGLYCILQTGG